MSKSDEQASCELCGRSGVQTTVHHLTPREKGGSSLPTAKLCSACHRQIHALYTNDDLITLELTSLAALRSDPSIAPSSSGCASSPHSPAPSYPNPGVSAADSPSSPSHSAGSCIRYRQAHIARSIVESGKYIVCAT